MKTRDYRDVIGGSLVAMTGSFVAIHSARSYPLGTPFQMGPGMFPAVLGCVLAAIGLVILVPALFRSGGGRIEVAGRPLAAVSAATAAFALSIERLGLVPAVVLMTVLVSLAERPFDPRRTAILTLVLLILSVGIFHYGLGLRLSLARWGF